MGFIEILDEVAKLNPVKIVLSAMDMAHSKAPPMQRSSLQGEIKGNASKHKLTTPQTADIDTDIADKSNGENRSRALTLEALGHKAQLSKFQYAEERITKHKAGNAKSVGDLIKDLEARQSVRKTDGNVDTYLKVHRSKSFGDSVKDLMAGRDGRRIDELKIVHAKQIEDMKRKVQPDPSQPEEIVADYLADELLLEHLKKRKASEDAGTALNAIGSDLKTQRERIEARELVIASRILKLTS